MEELAKHGITLPPNMQGLTEEQLSELNLHDEWEDECIPTGGVIENKDPIGRRNGKGQANICAIMPGEMAVQVTEKQFSELKSKKKRVSVFMGTWCKKTQFA